MTAIDPLSPLQAAIYSALNGQGWPVYDYVTEDAHLTKPYVTIGDAWTAPASEQSRHGHLVDAQIDVWSDYRGFAEANGIAGQILALLHHQPLAVEGFSTTRGVLQRQQPLRDPDPKVRHVALTFRWQLTQIGV